MAKATIRTRNDTTAASTDDATDCLTSAGDVAAGETSSSANAGDQARPAATAPQPKVTKLGQIRSLLQARDGATLAQLCEATGWQSHTMRAALTRLRQSGHAVERSKSAMGHTVYRIVETVKAERGLVADAVPGVGRQEPPADPAPQAEDGGAA